VECNRNRLLVCFPCLSAMGTERRSGQHRRWQKGQSADRDGNAKTSCCGVVDGGCERRPQTWILQSGNNAKPSLFFSESIRMYPGNSGVEPRVKGSYAKAQRPA